MVAEAFPAQQMPGMHVAAYQTQPPTAFPATQHATVFVCFVSGVFTCLLWLLTFIQ